MAKTKYQRVLLKISGEALGGDQGSGFKASTIQEIAQGVKAAHELGIQIGLVVGAGNFIRGGELAEQGIDRASGDYMGTTVESFGMMGYDRRHEVYTAVGFDTFGTYYVTAEGNYDAEKKQIVMSGEDPDPFLKHTKKYDFVLRFVDDDTYVLEIVFKDKAHTKNKTASHKMVEVTYTRVK